LGIFKFQNYKPTIFKQFFKPWLEQGTYIQHNTSSTGYMSEENTH